MSIWLAVFLLLSSASAGENAANGHAAGNENANGQTARAADAGNENANGQTARNADAGNDAANGETANGAAADGKDEIRVTGKRVRPESPKRERTLFSATLAVAETLASGRWFGAELARRSPALAVRASGGDLHSAYLIVRGASPVQMAYFLDGLPLLAGFGGLLDAAGLPAAGLSRVELFRGAAPAEFGPNAAGGALNLVPAVGGVKNTFHLYDTFGSFGTWKLSLAANAALRPVTVAGALSYATTLGNYPYFYDGGTIYTTVDDGVRERENNRVDQAQTLWTLSRDFSRVRLRAVLLASARRAGVPGPHSIVTRRTHHERTRLRAQMTVETPAGRSDLYAENVREHYHDPDGELGVGNSDDLHDFRMAGLRHRFLHTAGRHEFSAIAHAAAENWAPIRLTFGEPSQRTRLSGGLSGRARLRSSRWDLAFVLHGSLVHPDPHPIPTGPASEPLPGAEPHATWGGFAGFSFRAAPGLHIKGNAGRAVREPAFSELYGDFGVVKGNAALRPENSWNADAGALWEGRLRSLHLSAEAAVFGRRVEDLIQYVPNSQFVSLPVNVGKAHLAGVESGMQGQWQAGGMIVMDDRTCMVDVARYFIDFLVDESCGKCTPCREGLYALSRILDRICAGKGREDDLEQLESICDTVKETSLCQLGGSAPNPVLSTLKFFRDEYEAHIRDKKCPAGVCKSLISYHIRPEACTGCGACVKPCPTQAISGEKKGVHTIDAAKCIRCGICYEVCKFDAVEVK